MSTRELPSGVRALHENATNLAAMLLSSDGADRAMRAPDGPAGGGEGFADHPRDDALTRQLGAAS
jgi:hypothetical protein